jgi:hypothetical protein
MMYVVVRFQAEGFHYWQDAPPHRKYLSTPHRHLFQVEVCLEVSHDGREVECHDLLDFSRNAFGSGDFDGKSCEMLARYLHASVIVKFYRTIARWCRVSVLEDGEVGAVYDGES